MQLYKHSLSNHKYLKFVLISSAIPNIFLVNTIWTPTQGWYYEWATYLKMGLQPYRDFYLPFPPLMVFLNRAFLFFPDPLITERIAMLIIYSLMSAGIFKLLTLFTSEKRALFISVAATYIFQLSPTNTIAGYYEFALAFISWGLYLIYRKVFYKQFLGGILLACGSLVKQNFVLAVLVVLLSSFYLSRKRNSLRPFVPTFGIFSIYILFVGYLMAIHSTSRFIHIMLQGGGKNPHLAILLKSLLAPLSSPVMLFTTFSLVLLLINLEGVLSKKQTSDSKSILGHSFFFTALIFYFFKSFGPNASNARTIIFEFISIWIVIGIGLLGLRSITSANSNKYQFTSIIIASFTPLILFVGNEKFHSLKHSRVLTLVSISNLTGIFLGFSAWVISLIGVASELRLKTRPVPSEKSLKIWTFVQVHSKLNWHQATILFSLFFSGLINAFNGGADFDGNLIFASIGCAIFLNNFQFKQIKTIVALSIIIALSFSGLSIGLYNYSWFGWNELGSSHTKYVKSEPNIFRNMELTKYETDFYSKLKLSIAKAATFEKLNNRSHVNIMSFPMEPIVEAFNEVPRYQLNCPIMHFDVCPDNEAEIDLTRITRKPPLIVVYFDLGSDFVKANEAIWRNGQESTYRKISAVFKDSNHYLVIEKIPADSINLSDVYVLARK